MMERTEILSTMAALKLFGMKAGYDEIVATAVKRQHEPQRVVGDLLTAELSEKQARSIKYQMTIARMPFAKEIDEFAFADTPINETLVRDLAGGGFLEQQRNLVLVGGTGTGKTHLAVGIVRACIRAGARGRFFNVVDLVNQLEAYDERIREAQEKWPGLLVQPQIHEGMHLSELLYQDPYSYYLAILYLGAKNEKDLQQKYQEVVKFLDFEITERGAEGPRALPDPSVPIEASLPAVPIERTETFPTEEASE